MNHAELEERLIYSAAMIIKFTGSILRNPAGMVLVNQIVRSGSSPALNYGEARTVESQKDLVHPKFAKILKFFGFALTLKDIPQNFNCKLVTEFQK